MAICGVDSLAVNMTLRVNLWPQTIGCLGERKAVSSSPLPKRSAGTAVADENELENTGCMWCNQGTKLRYNRKWTLYKQEDMMKHQTSYECLDMRDHQWVHVYMHIYDQNNLNLCGWPTKFITSYREHWICCNQSATLYTTCAGPCTYKKILSCLNLPMSQ